MDIDPTTTQITNANETNNVNAQPTQSNPIPQIIELLDKLNASDADTIKQLQDYINQNPMSLNTIFAGMSVYSYAASLSLLALESVHEAFLLVRSYFKKLFKQYPFEIRDVNGYSPLHNAVEFNLPQQTKYLLKP